MLRVYDSSEKAFDNNGIRILHPMVAEITKNDNEDYYLELRDTIDNVDYYQKGMIIRADTPWGTQGFRCDNPVIKNRRIDCKAWHLSYDSENYLIKDSNVVDKNCNDALDHVNQATDSPSPFTVSSDIPTVASTRIVRKSLYEAFEAFASDDLYGGHFYRDNWNFSIKKSIGEDRGVVISANKNLSSIQVSENWDDVCTKVLPYTTNGEVAILLDETYVSGENPYDVEYKSIVKFENTLNKDDYESDDDYINATKKWLKEQAVTYLANHKLPTVSYSISSNINNVSDIGDVIRVKHSKIKVDILTNVIGIVYDCIKGRYKKITFGNFTKSLKDLQKNVSATTNTQVNNKIDETSLWLENEMKSTIAQINATLKNSNVIYDGDKILIVDTLPKENAKNVIKFDKLGISFSNTGIDGTFTTPWSISNIFKVGGKNGAEFEAYDSKNKLIAWIEDDKFQIKEADIKSLAIDGTELTENGTWEPELSTVDESTPTVTYTVRNASYSRIGSLVHISIYIKGQITELNGDENIACITGLPLDPKENNKYALTIGILNNATQNSTEYTSIISDGVINILSENGAEKSKLKVTPENEYFEIEMNGFYEVS